MKLTACGKTDIGRLRRNNEDSWFADTRLGLFIVADGMGGHAAGEIASALAVQMIREQLAPLLAKKTRPEGLLSTLSDAIRLANRAIAQAGEENPEWRGMGTTLTVLLLQAGQALLGHVGDSRLYRWRSGQLEQLSDDHSLVGDQLRRGLISREEADASNLRNILLQAVGITPELEICRKQLPLAAGDYLLLCSDGLTDMLKDKTITELLGQDLTPEQGCERLLEEALVAGGKDNISLVLVRVDEL